MTSWKYKMGDVVMIRIHTSMTLEKVIGIIIDGPKDHYYLNEWVGRAYTILVGNIKYQRFSINIYKIDTLGGFPKTCPNPAIAVP